MVERQTIRDREREIGIERQKEHWGTREREIKRDRGGERDKKRQGQRAREREREGGGRDTDTETDREDATVLKRTFYYLCCVAILYV